VKPPEFDYVAPETLAEAIAALRGEPEAKVLAGGQSLIPLLNFRLAGPALLVDLRRVPGLDRIESRDGAVSIGAMTRQRDAEESALLHERVPLLGEALRHVAHPQIRSRGTVGGSIAHADPAAELPAVLVALGGRVRAVSAGGERWLHADDLYTGFFTTALEPDEVLVEVELPAAPPRTGAACVEVARRAGDYAICGAVAQVSLHDDGRIADARLALVGVGSRPAAAPVAELLRDEAAEQARFAEAARAAAAGLEPVDDVQATAEYRRHLAWVLGRRALEQAAARAA
jgi:aerobic carbon-monoxide dehydrogenase medium subunit